MNIFDLSISTYGAILYLGVNWMVYHVLALDNRITDVVHRHARELAFPEDSEMGVNNMVYTKYLEYKKWQLKTQLPRIDNLLESHWRRRESSLWSNIRGNINDVLKPVSTKSISVAFFFEANYELPNNASGEPEMDDSRRKRSIDRRTIYEILQSKFESFGVDGRECLLRSICDTTRNPIHGNNGVLGDLMRIILTPSSSADEGLAVEYSKAEATGRGAGECGEAYPLCPFGIYDYITTVYE